jgi:tRNA G10  N-methylase Trm11
MQTPVKTEFVFIPGKNWRLSLAELASFLDSRRTVFAVREFSREFFEVAINLADEFFSADDFGGIIKIGVVKGAFPTQLLNGFVKNDKSAKLQIRKAIACSGVVAGMLEKTTRKHFFGVSVYCADRSLRGSSNRIHRFVGSSIKRELAEEGFKSDFMGFSRDRQFPQLTHVEVLKKGLVDKRAEVLFCVGREQTLIATTTAVHDPFEFQKRDVGKPVERRIFAMPPRLARIMMNLASCTSGKTLLDPFCGVGTILQEALLSGARVVGVDLNPWCVKAARENLEWLMIEYGIKDSDFTILQGDARRLSSRVRDIDCIATEPDLGPALRDVPTDAYAARIITKLEPLYFGFFEDAFDLLKTDGKLAVVTPYFQTRSGKPIMTRFDQKAEEIGFKQVFPFRKEYFETDNESVQNIIRLASLVDVAERHKTGREIRVFQK